jgi:hypothetical protein
VSRHVVEGRVGRAWSLLLLALVCGPLSAEAREDMQCFKMKDPLRVQASADVDTLRFGLDPGCTIKKAKLLCVPATKPYFSVSKPFTPFIDPVLPYAAAQPGAQVCYKVKCPIAPETSGQETDVFGTRSFTRLRTSLLCAPAAEGAAYCGDGTIDPNEQCEPADLGGATCVSRGFDPGTLACAPGCTFDTSACPPRPAPGSCGNGTVELGESCDGADLGGASCSSLGYSFGGTLACEDWCQFDTRECVRKWPATGQTTCWNSAGAVIPCAGTGHDGDIQAGAAFNFTDNGDGTITDENTKLMWEKLCDDGSIHDRDDRYLWDDAFAVKVAQLNTVPCFAGHCDWRLPNARELMSVQNLQLATGGPPAAFDTSCTAGCTLATCSCTGTPYSYWSSTSWQYPGGESQAFLVGMYGGGLGPSGKTTGTFYVRAVRTAD